MCVHIYYSAFKQKHSRALRRTPLPRQQGHPNSVKPREHSKLPQKKGDFVSSAITDLRGGYQMESSGAGAEGEGRPHRCAWAGLCAVSHGHAHTRLH